MVQGLGFQYIEACSKSDPVKPDNIKGNYKLPALEPLLIFCWVFSQQTSKLVPKEAILGFEVTRAKRYRLLFHNGSL